jgi:hypothetical protein
MVAAESPCNGKARPKSHINMSRMTRRTLKSLSDPSIAGKGEGQLRVSRTPVPRISDGSAAWVRKDVNADWPAGSPKEH